ncbi:MAG TPA: YceI family protein [Cyclobacteriaceae bacterium]|nr:YceI family protein [Cyclobacteriaceae bacterium]
MKKLNILLAILFLSVSAFAQTTWTLDKAHTKIGFNVVHMAVTEVEGKFNDFEGSVTTNSNDFNGADVTFTAKVASVDTDNERRDNHLKSDDFFNAEKFPELKFAGKLVKEGSGYKLKGDLTIRDVTKPVTLDVTYNGSIDTGRGVKAGFKVSGKINRQDYGLKFNAALGGGELVAANEVELIIKVELNKA